MHFITRSVTLAVALASFANAAPVSPIPGLTELDAWRNIFNDPDVNRNDYGTAVPKKFLSPQSACHLYCGTVIQFVREQGCNSDWEKYEGKCRDCFKNSEYGAVIKQTYESGVTDAANKCRIDQVPDQQEAEKPEAGSEWAEYGESLNLPKDVVACHAACGGIITNGREGKCDLLKESPNFISLCEECAIGKGIWGIYKKAAQEGAAKCGLEVNPQ